MSTQSKSKRVLAICLDGYETSLGEKLIAAGELPALARLRERSARFLLNHGAAQRTGLAGEHVSVGLSPAAADRWSAVTFDPLTYHVWQEGTSLQPFVARLKVPTVVFDPPYFDLDQAPSTRGVVNWGAHDPGIHTYARPRALLPELESRFGPYPAREWLYEVVWPSAERSRKMAEQLVFAADARAEAAHWLLSDRLPDWQLAIVVSGELHSAIEGLWHGIDPTHPLHNLPSAVPAGEGLVAVYRAVDRLVAKLTESFSDATVIAFAMGGMGPNRSDVASMILLPELLYRHAFKKPLLSEPHAWMNADTDGRLPMLGTEEDWSEAVRAHIHSERSNSHTDAQKSQPDFLRRAARRLLPAPARQAALSVLYKYELVPRKPLHVSLEWMPATRYQPYWQQMKFFALPSFYDGRIRISLAGRERDGKVSLSDYSAVCDEAEALVRSCRDSATGQPVVESVERFAGRDPRSLSPTASDLVIVWRGCSLGFDHAQLGRIGPVPYRRTGGHTGRFGIAYVSGEGIAPGDRGVRSSFDVVPTIIELLGDALPGGLSGSSLFSANASSSEFPQD